MTDKQDEYGDDSAARIREALDRVKSTIGPRLETEVEQTYTVRMSNNVAVRRRRS